MCVKKVAREIFCLVYRSCKALVCGADIFVKSEHNFIIFLTQDKNIFLKFFKAVIQQLVLKCRLISLVNYLNRIFARVMFPIQNSPNGCFYEANQKWLLQATETLSPISSFMVGLVE